jgi:hypothetical protein
MWYKQEANKTENRALRDMVSTTVGTYTACPVSLRENPLKISNESIIYIKKFSVLQSIFLPYNKLGNKTNSSI